MTNKLLCILQFSSIKQLTSLTIISVTENKQNTALTKSKKYSGISLEISKNPDEASHADKQYIPLAPRL